MKQLFVLAHPVARQRAMSCIEQAPDGMVVEVREPNRTLEQNAKLWAALTDLAEQVDWHGNRLTAEEWKDVMSAALKRQKVVPGIDGGFVVLGQRTSRMSKREFGDLIELIQAFGVDRGVVFGDAL